jgi:hypothetical protein
MYHPKGFIDSSHIIIKDNKAVYYYTGNSYLEKFKNGLSLEDKFNSDLRIEYNQIMNNEFTNKNKNSKKQEQKINKINYNDKNCSYKFPKERKGKYKCKIMHYNKEKENNDGKREKYIKKIKKNKIRQNGYDDKMFYISQDIIKPDHLLSETELLDIYYENMYEIPDKSNNYNYDFGNYNDFSDTQFTLDDYDKREICRYAICGY